jgi:hypothetical protein
MSWIFESNIKKSTNIEDFLSKCIAPGIKVLLAPACSKLPDEEALCDC